jgi:cytochrome b6-f complex iron-sulfur subunit
VWIVNVENHIIAISTVCTHLGCTPNWLSAENKFKCPCHGSGYYMNGVNFEGPTPRPLERFHAYVGTDGFVWVDKTQKCQVEQGTCDAPTFYIVAS